MILGLALLPSRAGHGRSRPAHELRSAASADAEPARMALAARPCIDKEAAMNDRPQPPPPGDTPAAPGIPPYPLRFDVVYPDRALNRVSSAFRIFAAIP